MEQQVKARYLADARTRRKLNRRAGSERAARPSDRRVRVGRSDRARERRGKDRRKLARGDCVNVRDVARTRVREAARGKPKRREHVRATADDTSRRSRPEAVCFDTNIASTVVNCRAAAQLVVDLREEGRLSCLGTVEDDDLIASYASNSQGQSVAGSDRRVGSANAVDLSPSRRDLCRKRAAAVDLTGERIAGGEAHRESRSVGRQLTVGRATDSRQRTGGYRGPRADVAHEVATRATFAKEVDERVSEPRVAR